ncbi:MAG: hypothetical protein WCC26_00705 [Terracidiphilus sp.]
METTRRLTAMHGCLQKPERGLRVVACNSPAFAVRNSNEEASITIALLCGFHDPSKALSIVLWNTVRTPAIPAWKPNQRSEARPLVLSLA